MLIDRDCDQEAREAFILFHSSLRLLAKAPEQDLGNEFILSGIVRQHFLQFDFTCKLFKAPLAYEGDSVSVSGSPRDVLKAAYKYYDFLDESTWLSMLRDRNNTAHVYDAESARLLVNVILDRYIPEFQNVELALRERYGNEVTQIA